MVKDAQKPAHSLEELDALFEKDRQAAAKLAELVFSQDVAAALTAVADIHEITNARIMADVQIASARLVSSAEVHSTALLASAETLRLTIQRHELSSPENEEIDSSIISELARNSELEIKTSAKLAIETIEAEAEAAVEKISTDAKKSIDEIKKIAADLNTQINENAQIAAAKLSEQKVSQRTLEDVSASAEKAAEEVMQHASTASKKLHDVVADTVRAVAKVADTAHENISKTVAHAIEKITGARDKALGRIREIVSLRKG